MRRYRRNGEMPERGGRGTAVPSNRTKFDVIAYGGNSRSLEWYSEGAVPPIPACSFLEWYGEGAVPLKIEGLATRNSSKCAVPLKKEEL